MAAPNVARGEASLRIGDCEYVLAVTMEGLGQLSAATECNALHELYQKLIGTELRTTIAALRIMVQHGTDAEGKTLTRSEASAAAAASLMLSDMAAVQECFVKLLEALTRKPGGEPDEPGNPSAGQI